MHVSSALNAIKKRGTFKAYKETHEAYKSNAMWQSKQRPLLPFSRLPLARARKLSRNLLRRLLKRSLQRNPLRRRRLPRTPRKAWLWLTHQTQNFTTSTMPSRIRPYLQKRPPRTRKKPLRPRCFSSMNFFVFGCQVCMEQDSPGADGG
jgi:hypothetical protein